MHGTYWVYDTTHANQFRFLRGLQPRWTLYRSGGIVLAEVYDLDLKNIIDAKLKVAERATA